MVGNSMKSDVLPALEAGAFGGHIPYAITWAHELADAPEGHPRYVALQPHRRTAATGSRDRPRRLQARQPPHSNPCRPGRRLSKRAA